MSVSRTTLSSVDTRAREIARVACLWDREAGGSPELNSCQGGPEFPGGPASWCLSHDLPSKEVREQGRKTLRCN